jgi:hypothetical protein
MPMTERTRMYGVGVMQSQDVDAVARSYPWLGVDYDIYVWLEDVPLVASREWTRMEICCGADSQA